MITKHFKVMWNENFIYFRTSDKKWCVWCIFWSFMFLAVDQRRLYSEPGFDCHLDVGHDHRECQVHLDLLCQWLVVARRLDRYYIPPLLHFCLPDCLFISSRDYFMEKEPRTCFWSTIWRSLSRMYKVKEAQGVCWIVLNYLNLALEWVFIGFNM